MPTIEELALTITSCIKQAADQGYLLVWDDHNLTWDSATLRWLDTTGRLGQKVTCPLGAVTRIFQPAQVDAGEDQLLNWVNQSVYAGAARALGVHTLWTTAFRYGYENIDNEHLAEIFAYKDCKEAYDLGVAVRNKYFLTSIAEIELVTEVQERAA